MPGSSPSQAPLPRARSARRRRWTSLLLAAAVAMVSAGVVLYFAVTSGNLGSGGSPGGGGPIPAAPPPVSSEQLTSTVQKAGGGHFQFVDPDNPGRIAGELDYSQMDPLPRGRYDVKDPRITLFLRDGRTVHVRAATANLKMPPAAGGDEPRKASRPESGAFHGGVVARMFAARKPGGGEGSAPIDPDKDEPILLVTAASLAFDRTTVLEFSTPDRVSVSGEQFEFQGVGLRVVYDEVAQHPALVQVDKREFIHVRRQARAAANESGPAPAGKTGSPQPTIAAAGKPHTPKEDLYGADLPGGVRVINGAQVVEADQLELWFRVLDGRLPPGAIAGMGGSPRAGTRSPTPALASTPAETPSETAAPDPANQSGEALAEARTDAPQPAAEPPEPTVSQRIASLRAVLSPDLPAPLTAVSDEDVMLLGDGPLVVAPLHSGAAPLKQLEKDDVALRFSSEDDRTVALSDRTTGAFGRAGEVEYRATTRDVSLSGQGPEGVVLGDGRGSTISMGHLSVNAGTGLAHISGPGIAKDARGRSVAWQDQAEFDLVLETDRSGPDERFAVRGLREARLTGGVAAKDERSVLTGDFQHVWFTAGGPAGAPQRAAGRDSILSRLLVEGHARGSTKRGDGGEDRLGADHLDVAFKPSADGKNADPNILTATGNVEAQQTAAAPTPPPGPGEPEAPPQRERTRLASMLRAGFLEANLGLDEKGHVAVVDATIRDKVHFERTDGVRADGDELRIVAATQAVDLRGNPAVVARGSGKITSPIVAMNGRESSLVVPTAGTFEYAPPAGEDVTVASGAGARPAQKWSLGPVNVVWTRSMRYDEKQGLVTCEGEAVATSRPDDMSIDTLRSERVVLRIEPRAKSDPAPDPSALSDAGTSALSRDFRLLAAEAIGAAVLEGDRGPIDPARLARVEMRRYIPDTDVPEGRRLVQLTYLENGRIVLDNQEGTLTAPMPGRAIVMDQRPRKPGDPPPDDGARAMLMGKGQGRGTSLFVWEGSLKVEKSADVFTLDRGVEVTHRPLGETTPIRMTCDHLDAFFQARDGGDARAPADSLSAGGVEQLVRAIARGEVTVESLDGNVSLRADEVDLDNIAKVVTATGQPGGLERATFVDKRRAGALVGRRVKWDIKKDEGEVTEAMPVTAPIRK